MSAGERGRLRDVDFPVALRGYERGAVDRYVERVSRLVAELEISASPESAIRHALAEVSEETRGLLERAHQTADEITARSRAKATAASTAASARYVIVPWARRQQCGPGARA